MGIDRKKSNESHHVVLAPQPKVLPGDEINLDRAVVGLSILREREGVKFRRVTRFEVHFSDNGDIIYRIHSTVDGSVNALVLSKDIDDEIQSIELKNLPDPE